MPRNLKKRGTVWWYRIQKNGAAFEGSLETDNLGVAKSRCEEVRRQLTASKFGEKPRRTFDEAARRFAELHFPKLRPKSRTRYAVSLQNLADLLHGKHLDAIDTATLSEFEEFRLKQKVATATIRRDLACLSSVFSRCEEWGWVTSLNPVKPYLRGRAKAGLTEGPARERYLSVAEELAVLAHAPPKATTLIAFAIDTGLRKEEQFSLTWADVDLDAREVRVRAEIAKNGKPRRVPLLDRAHAILSELARGAPGAYVWTTGAGKRYSPNSPTNYEALGKACRRAGVERASWHDLRRTCGCRLLQDRGLFMEEVSAWLGHGDVRITQTRYAFLKIEQLHKALRRPSKVVAFQTKNKLNGQN